MVYTQIFLLSVFSSFAFLTGIYGEECKTDWEYKYPYWWYNTLDCTDGCCGGPASQHVNQYCCSGTNFGLIFGLLIPFTLVFILIIIYCSLKCSTKSSRTVSTGPAQRIPTVSHATAQSTSTPCYQQPPPYTSGNNPAYPPNSFQPQMNTQYPPWNNNIVNNPLYPSGAPTFNVTPAK